MTRLDTAAMNLFLAELGQAVVPGAHGIVLMGDRKRIQWDGAGDHREQQLRLSRRSARRN